MKLAVVSDVDRSGGAAIAASRLCDELRRNGMTVRRFVIWKSGDDPDTVQCDRRSSVVRFADKVKGRLIGRGRVLRGNVPEWERCMLDEVAAWQPDTVLIHNLHSAALTPELVGAFCGLGVPVVWTLHDMWAFTGGCVYAYECVAFRDAACDSDCPAPPQFPPLAPEGVGPAIVARQAMYKGPAKQLTIVTPSRWLAREAASGVLSGNRVEAIANGIDLSCFAPMDKATARRKLGLPETGRFLLTGAQHLNDPRKGWRFLKTAMQYVSQDPPVTLVTYGSGEAVVRDVPTIAMGTISSPERMALCYNAVDAFVTPTMADNLPNVLVEAVACGIPCVAFDVGGVGEIIKNGQTGYLARAGNAHDLAAKLDLLLSPPEAESRYMAEQCRALAEEEFDSVRQAGAYQALFRDLLKSK